MSNINYWGYRIDNSKIGFFWEELKEGRLRQGWGWNPKQNLREIEENLRKLELSERKTFERAKKNLPMFRKVKKGDILLVPRIPEWEKVAIVRATEDWDKGYRFEITSKYGYGDYGHIFPAEYITSFVRGNEYVTGDIRSTLKNPRRFWEIKHKEDVENLKDKQEEDLGSSQDDEERLRIAVAKAFDEASFKEKVYEELNKQFSSHQWEDVLVTGLQKLFPYYAVERVGGRKEIDHGTDILIKMPSLLRDYNYGIAIQVKDWDGEARTSPIEQINKADVWEEDGTIKLIHKIVIITKSRKEWSVELDKKAEAEGIKIIFADELKELLSEIAKKLTL